MLHVTHVIRRGFVILSRKVDMTIRGIDEELYRQIAAIAAKEKKNVGNVVNEAMSIYLAQSSASALEAEWSNIVRKIQEIDGMALAGSPGATMLLQEYKERLQRVKEQMQQLAEEEVDIPRISSLGEVVLSKSDLKQLGRVVIENCQKVRLEDDVDQENLKTHIERISRVKTLEIPKKLHPFILLKVRDCEAIVRY